MNDADAEFEISMFQYERCGATCAFEEETRDGFVRSLWRRETDFPEIERFVNEGHTIGVEIALGADFTYDADFGFAIGFERVENQLLLGNECVTRQDAGSVKANNDGFSLLGEHTAFAIAADEQDGNCNGNASAATDLLARHLATSGKGPRVYPQTMVAKKRMMAKEM